jgi:transposase
MEDERSEKRIDDLAGRADRFETDVKVRFDKVDRELAKADHGRERFEDKVDARFDKMATNEQVDAINCRLDNWGKVITTGVVVIVGAVISKVCGV